MPGKLKVFRTPIGFHDAYVAAASQKSALEAWGSDVDLFARGVAEVVSDPSLTKEPLADPGKVIRVARGTVAEHLAALPKSPRKASTPKPPRDDKPQPRPRPVKPPRPEKPKPRPSRGKLDAAEQALFDTHRRHNEEDVKLRAREQALVRDRRVLERKHTAELDKVNRQHDRAREAYDRALGKWRG